MLELVFDIRESVGGLREGWLWYNPQFGDFWGFRLPLYGKQGCGSCQVELTHNRLYSCTNVACVCVWEREKGTKESERALYGYATREQVLAFLARSVPVQAHDSQAPPDHHSDTLSRPIPWSVSFRLSRFRKGCWVQKTKINTLKTPPCVNSTATHSGGEQLLRREGRRLPSPTFKGSDYHGN